MVITLIGEYALTAMIVIRFNKNLSDFKSMILI